MNIPQHVAFIMDGNRRWASERGLTVAQGHRAALEQTLKPLVEHGIARKIPYLTFWAFSTENRKRDREEVEILLGLFREALQKKLREFEEMGVRVKTIGDLSWFPKDIREKTREVMERTKNNKKITVTIALNYGGRDEIVRAINKLMHEKMETGNWKLETEEVTEGEFAQYLDTSGVPDPDLIIRTGGERRLSGYLPWQTVYSELYFTKTYWPDFTPSKFEEALTDYTRRTRRFGLGKFKDYLRKYS